MSLGVHKFLDTSTVRIARPYCLKLRNKFFLALPRAKISSLSNFQNIGLYFLFSGLHFMVINLVESL